jgi:hypothetical protein
MSILTDSNPFDQSRTQTRIRDVFAAKAVEYHPDRNRETERPWIKGKKMVLLTVCKNVLLGAFSFP